MTSRFALPHQLVGFLVIYNTGAINNWLQQSPAAPWKNLRQTQHSEAQLKVVVKDGEEIGATILYSQRTPIEIRRQTEKNTTAIEGGAGINSDHNLVMMTMKLKLNHDLRSHGSRLKFNLEKLKDREVADLFETTIGGKFAAINLLEEKKDNLTESIHAALVDTASEVLGKTKKKKTP